MKRITKKAIYILNIRNKTHLTRKNKHKYEGCFTHLIYDKNSFLDFELLEATYENDSRFSVFKRIDL